MLEFKIFINKVARPTSSIISIADRDMVAFEVSCKSIQSLSSIDVEVYLEDYKIPLILSEDGLVYRSQASNLFRESFGYSSVRVFVDQELSCEHVFSVTTNEERFNNIKDMMSYLLENNKRILDICFARTKYDSKNDGIYEASFDSVIGLAEKVVNAISGKQSVLRKELRHRLELVKEDVNEKNYYNINPQDIIENLDLLYQGYSPNSLSLFGKVYSLDAIRRENHIDSYDLTENHILLGGLVSIKETMLDILKSVENGFSHLTHDMEYTTLKPYSNKVNNYSIEELHVHLTTDGMDRRINAVLASLEELIYLFKKKLGISFNGYIAPKLTPYAKKSSFYLSVYTLLDDWYSLGSPDIGINHDLTKIRSTSKIYEFYTLYKLIDELYFDGWQVVKSVEHSFFKRFIPSQVEFKKGASSLILYYEKKVNGFTEFTQHNDLVALTKNNPKHKYNYYNPDFLLVKQKDDTVSYYILDAKYSSSRTLNEYRTLDTLFEKYFINFAVYNSLDDTLRKDSIKCVKAIHPFGNNELNKWSSLLPTVVPQVSSILLSKDSNNLNKIISLVNKPH